MGLESRSSYGYYGWRGGATGENTPENPEWCKYWGVDDPYEDYHEDDPNYDETRDD